MPNPNAVVSPVLSLDPPMEALRPERLREPGVAPRVGLEQGRSIALDPADPRTPGYAEVLDSLRRLRVPVYAEVDPDRGMLARLLMPVVDRVASLARDAEGGLLLGLRGSHAVRVLPAGSPDFAAFEALLRDALGSGAPVVVTVDDAIGIIDVRRPGPDWPLPPFPPPPLPIDRSFLRWLLDRWWLVWRWPWWPWWWFGCVTQARAQQAFDAMQATSCAPLTVPAPCIPFLYPDDGCFARAHEMCRLLEGMGLRPRKVWITGNLRTPTRNHPNCRVLWGWHVAPTLCVRGWLPWLRRTMVIDPSLFGAPVDPPTWKGAQGDAAAVLEHTDTTPFFHVGGDVPDPGYALTLYYLDVYRTALRVRAINQGAPPYAHCP